MSSINSIRNEDGSLPAYAWPGGYPIIYIADDGEVVCPECVNNEAEVHFSGEADGWRIDACGIHWEGAPEYCAHCNAEIESAYGDPEDEA